MERLQAINADRILWACADRHISLDELVAATGLKHAALDRVLNQDAGLTFAQIQKVANYLGRGVLFFMEPGAPDENEVHTARFRSLTSHKPTLSAKVKTIIERAEKQRDIYLDLLEELDLGDSQHFDPPQVDGLTPKEAAAVARQWANIGNANSFEAYRAALEAAGILVFRTNGYNGKWQIPAESPILGFSLYDEFCPLIVVRKQDADVRQAFTLAHELGHLLLHRASSIDEDADFTSTTGREREANIFAAHFLVPDEYLEAIDDQDRPQDVALIDTWLREQRQAWGVSSEVILLRLLEAGRLSRATYQAYKTWRDQNSGGSRDGGTRKYRHREPKHLFGDKFVAAVLDALGSSRITITRASSYLDGLKLNDIRQLEHFYAGR